MWMKVNGATFQLTRCNLLTKSPILGRLILGRLILGSLIKQSTFIIPTITPTPSYRLFTKHLFFYF